MPWYVFLFAGVIGLSVVLEALYTRSKKGAWIDSSGDLRFKKRKS